MERVERDREREREREKFCVINVKYKEISQGQKKKEEKKVTSRSTEELVLKKIYYLHKKFICLASDNVKILLLQG